MATIAIIGFMAVGKTSVAKILANRLGYEMIDLDEVIAEEEEMSIAEIFTTYGEAYFRQAEHEAVLKYTAKDRVVIATGGGVVLSAKNRQALKENCYLICLTSQPEIILKRVEEDGATRPMLTNEKDPYAAINKLSREREALYDGADLYIDTSELSVVEIVEQVLARLPGTEAQS